MDDTYSRLEMLRIDRGDAAPVAATARTSRRRWQLCIAIVLVLGASAGAVAWLIRTRPAVPARVVTAQKPEVDMGRPPPAGAMLDASGYVEAHRQATVSAKSIYRVRQVLVQEGQKVHEGEVIARLDDSNSSAMLEQSKAQLALAQANLEAAKTAMDDAGPIYRRNEQQLAAGAISAQAFDAAKATYNATRSNYTIQLRAVDSARATVAMAQRSEDDTIVRAPFSGVVTDIAAEPGEIVSPSTAGGFTRTGICTIVDMGSLEADVDVSENFINRVRVGQAATVRLNAYPDWEIPAGVLAIIPAADRSKATVRVRVSLEQKDPRILPSMGARVAFLN
jgi:RND family efflux transporter MFP subunit